MAGEIIIPCRIFLHRTNNPKGLYTHLPVANQAFMPDGFRAPTADAVDYQAALAHRIRPGIHATPNGKLSILWSTRATDTTNATRIFLKVKSLNPNADAFGFTTWDDELSVDDVSNGQDYLNQAEVSISSATLSAGRTLAILLRRDKPGTPADALAAEIYFHALEFIADEA